MLVGADQRLQRGVGVLDQQPPAGAQRLDHGAQHGIALGHMDQDETGVDQVEGPGRGCVAAHVVADHFHSPGGGGLRPGDIDVGGEHASARPDAFTEPRGDARPAGPDLPAPPSLVDPDRLEVPERRGVEEGRQRLEAGTGLDLPVVQEISLVLPHAPIMSRPFPERSGQARASAVRAAAGGAVPHR